MRGCYWQPTFSSWTATLFALDSLIVTSSPAQWQDLICHLKQARIWAVFLLQQLVLSTTERQQAALEMLDILASMKCDADLHVSMLPGIFVLYVGASLRHPQSALTLIHNKDAVIVK
ncbi:hypothetical protein Mapa_016555 [Marchantia paleacea]|nr:hypothetical protein Mapa_016555 [Marchantia paleacea]